MPKILPLIKKQIPNISISIVEEKTDILVEMLSQGKIDLPTCNTYRKSPIHS